MSTASKRFQSQITIPVFRTAVFTLLGAISILSIRPAFGQVILSCENFASALKQAEALNEEAVHGSSEQDILLQSLNEEHTAAQTTATIGAAATIAVIYATGIKMEKAGDAIQPPDGDMIKNWIHYMPLKSEYWDLAETIRHASVIPGIGGLAGWLSSQMNPRAKTLEVAQSQETNLFLDPSRKGTIGKIGLQANQSKSWKEYTDLLAQALRENRNAIYAKMNQETRFTEPTRLYDQWSDFAGRATGWGTVNRLQGRIAGAQSLLEFYQFEKNVTHSLIAKIEDQCKKTVNRSSLLELAQTNQRPLNVAKTASAQPSAYLSTHGKDTGRGAISPRY